MCTIGRAPVLFIFLTVLGTERCLIIFTLVTIVTRPAAVVQSIGLDIRNNLRFRDHVLYVVVDELLVFILARINRAP
jgi:hypothetical protein